MSRRKKYEHACGVCGSVNSIINESYVANCKKHHGVYVCRVCARPSTPYNQLTLEEVRSRFIDKGWDLISASYSRNQDPLSFICSKHPELGIQITSVAGMRLNTGCAGCTFEAKSNAKRKPLRDVFEVFEKSKYIPMFTFDEYKTCKQLLPYLCTFHQDDGLQYASIHNIERGQACRFCKRDKMTRENHFAWKGGVSKLKEHLRHHILTWKIDSMRSCNNSCVIGGGRFNHIHHLHSFDNMVEEALEEEGLPRLPTVDQYTESQISSLVVTLIAVHSRYPLGVCLKEEHHKEFHNIYTRGNNTVAQFSEYFLRKTGKIFEPKYMQW